MLVWFITCKIWFILIKPDEIPITCVRWELARRSCLSCFIICSCVKQPKIKAGFWFWKSETFYFYEAFLHALVIKQSNITVCFQTLLWICMFSRMIVFVSWVYDFIFPLHLNFPLLQCSLYFYFYFFETESLLQSPAVSDMTELHFPLLGCIGASGRSEMQISVWVF